MTTIPNLFKVLTSRQVIRNSSAFSCFRSKVRNYADKSKADSTSKQIAVQGTENQQRVRVRRARPADIPRVLRFVRENALAAWPGLVESHTALHVILCDYVTRALAQGHTMLAEQMEVRRGWSNIRGVALAAVVCSWDATMLEKWARCVRCTKSRRLMNFTAHCLRAPALHDKYRVHNIMQVFLIVPQNTPRTNEIIHVLTKNAIQRGRDVGYPLIRFDVTNEDIAKSLEEIPLTKEFQLSYEVLPDIIKENEVYPRNDKQDQSGHNNFLAVYTAFTHSAK